MDETALDSVRAGVIPDNTAKNNRWALNNFAEWTKSRASSSEPVPEGILSSCDAELVTKWLSLRFGNMLRVHYQKSRACRGIPFMHVTRLINYHNT